jgi:hypothetical protein
MRLLRPWTRFINVLSVVKYSCKPYIGFPLFARGFYRFYDPVPCLSGGTAEFLKNIYFLFKNIYFLFKNILFFYKFVYQNHKKY